MAGELPTWDQTKPVEEKLPTWDQTTEVKKAPQGSILETAGSSSGDAALFGLSDKIGGGIAAISDLLQRSGNYLLPDVIDPSTSQINEQLTQPDEFGNVMTGDVGPSSPMDVYRQNRDEIQARQDELNAANPTTALLSSLVGGGASAAGLFKNAPKLASKLAAPFGELAKDATLLNKTVRAGANALPLSAALALESNSADFTKGELPQLDELALTTGLGVGIGATVPSVVAGGTAIANSKAGQSIGNFATNLKNKTLGLVTKLDETAGNLGREGVDITSPNFIEETQQMAGDLIPSVSKVAISDRDSKRQSLQQAINNLDEVKTNIDIEENNLQSNVDNLSGEELFDRKKLLDEQKTQLELLRAKAKEQLKAEKVEEIDFLNKKIKETEKTLSTQNAEQTASTVKQMESTVDAAFDNAGKSYNTLDKKLDNLNVKYDFTAEIEDTLNKLPTEELKTQYKKQFASLAKTNLDRFGFVDLRNLVDDLERSTPEYTVKRVLRDLKGTIRKKQEDTIKTIAGTDALNELKDLNNHYRQLSSLDEKFFSQEKDTASRKTLKILQNAANPTNEAAVLANQAFNEQLAALPDQTIQNQLKDPVGKYVQSRQTLDDPKEIADIINNIKGIKQSATGTLLDESVQAELVKNETFNQLTNKISNIESAIKQISQDSSDVIESSVVKNARTQLEIFNKQKDQLILDAKNKLAKVQDVNLKDTNRISNKITPTTPDTDITDRVRSIILNPKKDKVMIAQELEDLISFYKHQTGKDITSQVKSLQDRSKYIKPEALENIGLEDTVIATMSPAAAIARKALSSDSLKSKVANKAGMLIGDKKAINDAANKASAAGFNSLGAKIQELSDLPEDQAAQKLFLLQQSSTFRNLFKDEDKK